MNGRSRWRKSGCYDGWIESGADNAGPAAVSCSEIWEIRDVRVVSDYKMPNVSEKVVRIILSYTDYIKESYGQRLTCHNGQNIIHSIVFKPDGVSTAYLYADLVIELKKCGHELTVLTSTPHYNYVADEIKGQSLTKNIAWELITPVITMA